MPASSPDPAVTAAQAQALYAGQQAIALSAIAATDTALGRTDDLDRLAAVIALFQLAAAQAAATSYDQMAGEPLGLVASAFAGTNAIGLPHQVPLETIFDSVRSSTSGSGRRVDARNRIVRYAVSQVQDAGRAAGQAAIVTHPAWTNYVRVLKPPSCGRCAILAGRVYRDLDHFARHPQCDCVMVPVADWQQAHDEGLVSSPQAAFDAGQVTGLSAADAQAVADGADIGQVVNAAQGMTNAEMFGRKAKATLAGTSRRSAWRREHPDVAVRVRPETIYAEASGRDDAIRLLKRYGFITGDGPASRPTPAAGDGAGIVVPPVTAASAGGGDDARVLPFDDDHLFDGELGDLGNPTPLTVAELEARGLVADASDRLIYADLNARDAADWLAEHNVTALSVRESTTDGERVPDFVLDQYRVTVEAKAAVNTVSSLVQRIRSGRGQSRRVLVDGRRGGVTDAIARAAIDEVLRKFGAQLTEIVIVLPGGRAVGWWRGTH